MTTIDPEGPIHEVDGVWYFWDESWANQMGPFPTREIAVLALSEYAKYLEGVVPDLEQAIGRALAEGDKLTLSAWRESTAITVVLKSGSLIQASVADDIGHLAETINEVVDRDPR